MSDLTFAIRSLIEARDGHDEAESFYEGTADESSNVTNPRIRALLRGGSSKFRLNYARCVVSSRLSRLEISSVTSPDATAAALLDAIWTGNAMDQESHDTHEAALEFGESYVAVSLNEDESGVDIFFNSPKTVRMFYAEENPRVPRMVVKVWNEGEKTRVNLHYPGDRLERYISVGKLGDHFQDSDFVPYVEEEGDVWPELDDGTMRWFHFRTKRQYGRPEHKDAFGPQNMINKLVSAQMASVDFAAIPQKYGLKDPTFNGGVSDADDLFDEDDETVDDVARAGLTSQPGGFWDLKGFKEVGEFATADQAAFLEPLREYRQAISELTGTPISAFKGSQGQMPSGESRRAAEIPLVKRVEDLQRMLGGTWKELYAYALRLLGAADARVDITWTEAESYDDTDTWESAKAQQEAKVPVRQTLLERGYRVEQLDAWGVPQFGEEAPVAEVAPASQ